MLSRSWWTNVRELRGTPYRLQCTCRRASREVERVPHCQRSSQKIWQWPCGNLSTRQGKDDIADQGVALCRTDSITGQTLVIDSGRFFH